MPPNAFRYFVPFLTCYVISEGYYIKTFRSNDLNKIADTLLDYISNDKLLADELLYAKETLQPKLSVYKPVIDVREAFRFPSNGFANDFQETDDFAKNFQENDDYAKDFQDDTSLAEDFPESDSFASGLKDKDNYGSNFYDNLMRKLVPTFPGQDKHSNSNVNLMRKRNNCSRILIVGPLIKELCR